MRAHVAGLLVVLSGGYVWADVAMYLDRSAFETATGATPLTFPSRLVDPYPTCDQQVTYDTQVNFSFGTNHAWLTAPFATTFASCYPANFGPLLALIPAGYTDESQDCPFPVDTITGHGEDDQSLVFDVPVHAVGFDLYSNDVANETLTLKDVAGNVLASVSLGPLTSPCQRRFFGFTSGTSIAEVFLDTEFGGFSNGGYGAILVSESLPPPGPPVPCDRRPHGAVSWLPGDGSRYDVVGINHGALVGGVAYDAGQVGQAFSLSGSGQYIDLGQDSSLDINGDETVEMWVKLDRFQTTNPQTYLFADFEASGSQAQVSLRTSSGRLGYYQAHTDGSTLSVDGPPTLRLGEWMHVASVRDDSAKTVTLFVDGWRYLGASYAGKTVIAGSLAGHTAIGRSGSYDGDYMDGSVDEVGVYARALTDCEIRAIYLSRRKGLCKGDRDDDGLRDPVDNCIDVYNPGQLDEDLDHFGDACDCAPSNGSVHGAPGDIGNVFLGEDGDPDGLEWCLDELPLGSGTSYDVVRGSLGELPVGSGGGEICVGSDLAEPSLTDSQDPLPARGFWYVVRGGNICGIGSYGYTSSGNERITSACP